MTGSWRTTLACLVVITFATSESKLCKTKSSSIFESEDTSFITCPGLGDPSYFTECCGPTWERKCCATRSLMNWGGDDEDDVLLDFDEADIPEGAKKLAIDNFLHIRSKRMAQIQNPDSIIETLPEAQKLGGKSILKFVGLVIGLVILLVVVSIICCCCLPCCFLAKRRTREGAVHGPATTHDPGYPAQQAVPLNQHNAQGGAYPPYSTQPPQSAYPPQNMYSSPPQGAYPPPGAPPSYSDNPPPYPGPPAQGYQDYPTKQPAFNPNM